MADTRKLRRTIRIGDVTRAEADAIEKVLEDERVFAFVRVVAALEDLPTDRARVRVLRFVADRFDDSREPGE